MTIHSLPSRVEDTFDRPVSLGFLSPHNAYDRRTFSGTPFFAAEALQRRTSVSLRILGAHRPPTRLDRLARRASKPTRFEDCDFDGLDAVIGLVASPLLDALSQTHPGLPFLHVTDATPTFLREAYGWAIPAEAEEVEARISRQAAACVYSSTAMADRAPADLNCEDLRRAVQPFGVNFDDVPQIPPIKPAFDKINLLFVGLDWHRKGGDIAVAALDNLREAGLDATLTIVGRCPERHRDHPNLRSVGFLNKNKPRDAARLAKLYSEAHLLLLPSRADCTPMVLAEAMAHGTPVLATDVGGIRAQIGSGGAGRCLPPYSTPSDWTHAIRDLLSNREAYDYMSDAASERVRHALSWDSWATGVERLARQAIAQDVHTPIPSRISA